MTISVWYLEKDIIIKAFFQRNVVFSIFFYVDIFCSTPQILPFSSLIDAHTVTVCTCTSGHVWTEVHVTMSIKLTDFNFLPGLEKPCMESWSLNTFKFSSLVKHDRLSMLQNSKKLCKMYAKSMDLQIKKPDLK